MRISIVFDEESSQIDVCPNLILRDWAGTWLAWSWVGDSCWLWCSLWNQNMIFVFEFVICLGICALKFFNLVNLVGAYATWLDVYTVLSASLTFHLEISLPPLLICAVSGRFLGWIRCGLLLFNAVLGELSNWVHCRWVSCWFDSKV